MSLTYGAYDVSAWAAVALRAPDAAWDGSHYVGGRLESINEARAAALGLEHVLVREGQFCAVAAASREAVLQVVAALQVKWSAGVVARPAAASKEGAEPFTRQYQWRFDAASVFGGKSSTYGSEGLFDPPSKAEWAGGRLTLWAITGRDQELAAEAAAIFNLPESSVRVVGAPAAPDQPAYDAAIDAAIVARFTGRAIQVWPVRQSDVDSVFTIQESARLEEGGRALSWTTQPDRPDALRPSAASISLKAGQPLGRVFDTAAEATLQSSAAYAPAHQVAAARATLKLDSVISIDTQYAARVFSQESFADELAQEAGSDPIQWRLQQLHDPVGRSLIEQVSAAAGWRKGVRGRAASDVQSGVRRGQGFAWAQRVDETQSPPKKAWAAWVVDVSVDSSSGSVSLDNITVGHHLDELLVTNADDPRWGGELTKAAQVLLNSGAQHDNWQPPQDAGGLDLMASGTGLTPYNKTQPPAVNQSTLASPAALSSSSALGLPAAAAVANAIYDATGIRLREAPFELGLAAKAALLPGSGPEPKRKARGVAAWLLCITGGVAGALMAAIPWRPTMPPVSPDLSVYSSQAIERGRLIAASSNCVACHTVPGGVKNAGGLAMDTPFGTIYSTNITPDPETGLGSWSFAAFDRAMREGVSRDGRFLYPAFPYTSFAKFSDADMQALYAYLMSEPAVKSAPPATQLAFPYNIRSGMAYWNLMFHENKPYTYDDAQTPIWNRGAYLVQGAGHCTACHSPRNALGAEKNGPFSFLAGGVVDGWDAPALNGTAPVAAPWTTQDLFQYLRTGHSERHGVAAGPMAPVITSLQGLPDSDIHAMAVYLSSLANKDAASPESEPAAVVHVAKKPAETLAATPSTATPSTATTAVALTAAATAASPEPRVLSLAGKNLYEGACAACHDASSGVPMFGVRPSMPLNTNVTADKPDNLIRIVLEGISQPVDPTLGYMPGFADVFSDTQVAELVSYLRDAYAPQQEPWANLEQSVQRVRAESERHAASVAGVLP